MDMRSNHHKVFINTLATSAQDLRQTRRQASHTAYKRGNLEITVGDEF
jgi:hypothetical protein